MVRGGEFKVRHGLGLLLRKNRDSSSKHEKRYSNQNAKFTNGAEHVCSSSTIHRSRFLLHFWFAIAVLIALHNESEAGS